MEFTISTDKKLLDISLISDYLKNTYWANKRSISSIETSIENSICFGVYLGQEQIGFARIVTDKSVFSYLMDVFIIDEYKGNGYGKKLIAYIYDHQSLIEVENHYLMTKDAQDFYSIFGFEVHEFPDRFMKKT